jgi:hypothetical protein
MMEELVDNLIVSCPRAEERELELRCGHVDVTAWDRLAHMGDELQWSQWCERDVLLTEMNVRVRLSGRDEAHPLTLIHKMRVGAVEGPVPGTRWVAAREVDVDHPGKAKPSLVPPRATLVRFKRVRELRVPESSWCLVMSLVYEGATAREVDRMVTQGLPPSRREVEVEWRGAWGRGDIVLDSFVHRIMDNLPHA